MGLEPRATSLARDCVAHITEYTACLIQDDEGVRCLYSIYLTRLLSPNDVVICHGPP